MLAHDDPAATYRLLEREFAARGYSTRVFYLGDSEVLEVVSPKGRRWVTPIAHMSYPMQTAFTKEISIHKDVAYDLMQKAELPIPFTHVVRAHDEFGTEEATALIREQPCVIVKPADSSLSRGLTLGITDPSVLTEAIAFARQSARNGDVLVQQQVAGEEIRFVYLDGKIVAALLRETAKLTGDGEHSVKQLLEKENNQRANIENTLVAYPQLNDEMIQQGIDLECVPANGETIELSHSTMIRGGASIYNVIATIDPSYCDLARRAAEAVGTGFIVIDMMIKNYKQPFDGTNAFFNEFNTAPVLKLCYSCRDGNQLDIVPLLVDAIDKRIHL
jgi:cyanophycin synthetase